MLIAVPEQPLDPLQFGQQTLARRLIMVSDTTCVLTKQCQAHGDKKPVAQRRGGGVAGRRPNVSDVDDTEAAAGAVAASAIALSVTPDITFYEISEIPEPGHLVTIWVGA